MGLTVSSIISEYGAYYEKSGQNMSRILKMITQDTETTKLMTQIKTDETIFKLAQGTINDLIQPFQKAFTAKGTAVFTPNKIELQHMKVDFEIYPDDIEATWLGFLASENLSRKEWPLVRFLLEQYLLPKMRENLELKVAFKGVQKDPTTDVAGNPEDVMNGIEKLLTLGIAAGTINQVTGIGALNANTIFDQVEAFHDGISQVYQGVPMVVCMSPAWRKAYFRDKRANGFYQISGANQIDDSIDFTPHKVAGLPSMSGSNILWATTKENMLHITKKGQNAGKFLIEESKRCVSIMTDWWEAIGFGINEIVWTTAGTKSGSGSN